MINLSANNIRLVEEGMAAGTRLETILPASIGNTVAAEGLWRFFSDIFPPQGVQWWNSLSSWKEHWKPFMPEELFSFGEDIFGNQLVIMSQQANVFLWNHEDGGLFDLLLEPAELLSTVVESGIDWIDFYGKGSLEVARSHQGIPDDSHLHWTTPLILGGGVGLENLTVVDRERHLVGHAKLWMQVRGLEPGSTVIINTSGE